jgi:excisionase family DNA binding protein
MPRLKKKWTTPPVVIPEAAPVPCKDFMNLKEAATYLGVTLWTIRGLINKKLLVAKLIGKYFVVRRVDLDAVWEQTEAA